MTPEEIAGALEAVLPKHDNLTLTHDVQNDKWELRWIGTRLRYMHSPSLPILLKMLSEFEE